MSVDVSQTAIAPRNDLESLLMSRRSAMEAVLPKHLTPDRLIKIASVAVSRNELLKKCTPLSIVVAVMTAAQLGLDCGGALGSAYLVPFKRSKKVGGDRWQTNYECQLIIGYRGLIDLARRSGHIMSIESRVVYQNDLFDVEYGREGVQLKHKPALDADPGQMRLVYALATLKDGGHQFELMTRTQIDGIKARSQAKDNGPWVTDYDEMARKTVVKRLCKSLPLSTEFHEAIVLENRNEYGEDDVPLTPLPPTGAAQLNSRLRQAALPPPEDQRDQPLDEGSDNDSPTDDQADVSTEKQTETEQTPTTEITDQMIGTWEAFCHSLCAIGDESSVDKEVSEACILKLRTSNLKVASSRTSDAMKARREVLIAARNGQLDWVEGKIVE